MTLFGEYKAQRLKNGSLGIDPTNFIQVNWPVLSEIAELYPAPWLLSSDETPPPSSTVFEGMAVLNTIRKIEVWIQPQQLLHNCQIIRKSEGDMVAFLWTRQVACLREILVTKGIFPQDQFITEEVALRGGFETQLIKTIKENPALDPLDPFFTEKLDSEFVQCSVYRHLLGMAHDGFIDEDWFKTMIRLESDDVYPGMLFW